MKSLKQIVAVALTTAALGIAPAFAAHHGDKENTKTGAETEAKAETKVKPGEEKIELEETQKADQEPTEHMKDVTDGDKDKKAKMDKETEEKEEMKN